MCWKGTIPVNVFNSHRKTEKKCKSEFVNVWVCLNKTALNNYAIFTANIYLKSLQIIFYLRMKIIYFFCFAFTMTVIKTNKYTFINTFRIIIPCTQTIVNKNWKKNVFKKNVPTNWQTKIPAHLTYTYRRLGVLLWLTLNLAIYFTYVFKWIDSSKCAWSM